MVGTASPSRPHTAAFLTALQAAGLAVKVGVAPSGGGWQGGRSSFVPYAVLFPMPGNTDGDLADPNTYLDYQAQVTVVGVTADQTEATMDKAKAALVGARLAVAGRSSYRVRLEPGGRPITRDDQVTPAEYYCSAIFSLRTGPA